jgi:hypothetical protein
MSLSESVRSLLFEGLKLSGYKVVHFIHIGKTAGSALKEGVRLKKFIWQNVTIGGKYIFQMEKHPFTMKHLKEDEYVFFIVRDPIGRFISGFYSRLRKGQPRLYNPWSPEEEIAFGRFDTPNEIGEALSSADEQLKLAAENALKGIGHVNTSFWDWFISEEYVKRRKKSLLFFLKQETLEDDLKRIGNSLGFSFPPLAKDEVSSHKNPEHFDKKLSATAQENLREWFRKEYNFLSWIEENSKDGIFQ